MSQSNRSLSPELIQAAVKEVKSRLDPDEPLTLDALETAVLEFFKRDLAPAVMEEVVAPEGSAQKRGHRRSAAGRLRAG